METKTLTEIINEEQSNVEFMAKVDELVEDFKARYNRDIEVCKLFSNQVSPSGKSAKELALKYLMEEIQSGSLKLVVEPANYDFLSTPLVNDTFVIKRFYEKFGYANVLELEGVNTKVIAKVSISEGGLEDGM